METISNKSTSSELEDKSLRSVNESPLQVQLQSSTAEPKEGHYIELQSSTAEPKEGNYIELQSSTAEPKEGDYTELQSSTAEPEEEHYYIDGLAPTYTTLTLETTNTNYYVTKSSIVSNSNAAKDLAIGKAKLSDTKQSVWSTPFIVITVLLFIILIVMVAILCMMVAHIASNRTSPDFNQWANGVSQNTLQLFQNNTNFTELDKQILQTTRDSAKKLINIVNTLSNLQDTSTSTAGVVDDILLIAQELLVLHNDSTALPTSCKEIKERQPLSPSGYYILVALNGDGAYETYCNMGELCGSGGGWTRLAYLDMSDATQNCPSGFRLYQSGGVRACGRPVTNSSSCVSVQFPSNGISYSQICGRVTGYQFFSPNAFIIGSNDINSHYVDGVSITRGSPRQHVWTLANGLSDSYNNYPYLMCPCSTGSTQTVPSFVGNHYFCESGNHASSWFPVLYTSDPLWDGQSCGVLEATCCAASGLPWFHRDYGSTTTTDYIELRVCSNQANTNEDSPVSFYEIYVK